VATSGGFAAFAWYLVKAWIPKERENFAKQLEAQQSRFERTIEREREHCRELLEHITTQFLNELKKHRGDRDEGQ
jgi:hypothetical protein